MELGPVAPIGQAAVTVATVLAALVTAIATVFLWRVTSVLAVETKRMAEASAQPQVVAHIEPNRWASNHADLFVANTGNASAFDVRVAFDPPLERDEKRSERPVPLQRISLLKPGQEMNSWIGGWAPLLKKTYTVQISWKRHPGAADRETLIYTLDMNDIEGMSRLGASDPMVQVADQLKKLREDWQSVARGHKRVSVDIYSSEDREDERDSLERMWAEEEEESASPAPTDEKSDPRG